MDLDSIKNSYYSLETYKKVLIIVALTIAMPVYSYFTEAQDLKDTLELENQSLQAANKKLSHANKLKSELPKLEQNISNVRKDLKKARNKLPDFFAINDVLHKTALISEDSGVSLLLFKPENSILSGTVFRFVQMPIKLEAIGT